MMSGPSIHLNSLGSYEPFLIIIGLILFGFLIADFVWIYIKFSKKGSDDLSQKRRAYGHSKIWEHP